jgi:hypothetical protein
VALRDGRTLVVDVADNRLSVFADAEGHAGDEAATWVRMQDEVTCWAQSAADARVVALGDARGGVSLFRVQVPAPSSLSIALARSCSTALSALALSTALNRSQPLALSTALNRAQPLSTALALSRDHPFSLNRSLDRTLALSHSHTRALCQSAVLHGGCSAPLPDRAAPGRTLTTTRTRESSWPSRRRQQGRGRGRRSKI